MKKMANNLILLRLQRQAGIWDSIKDKAKNVKEKFVGMSDDIKEKYISKFKSIAKYIDAEYLELYKSEVFHNTFAMATKHEDDNSVTYAHLDILTDGLDDKSQKEIEQIVTKFAKSIHTIDTNVTNILAKFMDELQDGKYFNVDDCLSALNIDNIKTEKELKEYIKSEVIPNFQSTLQKQFDNCSRIVKNLHQYNQNRTKEIDSFAEALSNKLPNNDEQINKVFDEIEHDDKEFTKALNDLESDVKNHLKKIYGIYSKTVSNLT